jgi:hypothetical protein
MKWIKLYCKKHYLNIKTLRSGKTLILDKKQNKVGEIFADYNLTYVEFGDLQITAGDLFVCMVNNFIPHRR